MSLRCRCGLLSVVVGCLFFAGGGASLVSAQDRPAEVTPQETIQFEQDKAQAHMRELEQRMFRLAELIRESQPEDAARLVLGVQKSREHLIADRMAEASQLLATLKLDRASEAQQEVIQQLEELKRLLLSTDIDLQLKLEQLRKIKEARARLGDLMAREQSQKDDVERLVKEDASAELPPLSDVEKRNQRLAEDLEQLVKQFGAQAAGAAGAIGAAGQSMAGASASLSESQGGDASQQQAEALEKLAQADASLQDLEEELKKELEAYVRQRVMENLTQMIAEQHQVRTTTEKLAPKLEEGRRETVLAVKRLGEAEEKVIQLGEETLGLCELVEFSLAFPPALQSVLANMETVADDLNAGRADDEIIEREAQIEADLQELLNALKQASRPSSGQGGQCSGCQGNRNKLLAEVKMLRWMEIGLNKKTRQIEERFSGAEPDRAEHARQVEPLMEQQMLIQELTRKLHDQTCQDCLGL